MIFIKTVHAVQSMSGNLLDSRSYLDNENGKTEHDTRKKIDLRNFLLDIMN